jgi:4-hydroxy-3-methylbut-2-enyl diphosphate reductase
VRAIEIVDLALACFERPVYVRREIVHNSHVVRDFEARGVRFVQELDEVPDGATAVFSAHGVSPQVRASATARGLRVIDATCPLVTKVHLEAIRFARMGYEILLVGHAGHEEVEGTMGRRPRRSSSCPPSRRRRSSCGGSRACRVHHADDAVHGGHAADRRSLRVRFQDPRAGQGRHLLRTQNRQVAVRATRAPGPGHSRRGLAQLLQLEPPRRGGGARRRAGLPRGRRVGIDPAWLEGVETIGITSGASAPEFWSEIVACCAPIARWTSTSSSPSKKTYFPCPRSGRRAASAAGGDAADPLLRPEDAAVVNPPRLADKVAFVTGASRGIGEATARRLGAEGARVVLAARDLEACERHAGQMRAAGQEAVAVNCDVTNPVSVSAAIAAAVLRWTRIDILVNNAGLGGRTPLDDPDDARWDAILRPT